MTLENQTFLIDGLEINVSVPVYYPANYISDFNSPCNNSVFNSDKV